MSAVKITLEFNSIDEAIAHLMAAGNKKPAIVEVKPGLALESGEFVPAEDIPAPKAQKAEKATPAAAPAEAPASAASTATSSDSPASTCDYPTLQKAVFTLAGKSREAAAAVAATFGVKTFKELPEDKWADALAAVQAKTAELG